jgi:WD40 repeat protein
MTPAIKSGCKVRVIFMIIFATSLPLSAGQASTDPFKTLQASSTKHEVDCLGFSGNGKVFFAGALDSYATIWSTDDWHPLATLKPDLPPARPGQKFRMLDGCTISPTGDTFAIGSEGLVTIYMIPNASKVAEIRVTANGLSYSADGRQLMIGSHNGVEVFDTKTWSKRQNLSVSSNLPANASEVTALVISPDGTRVAAGSRTGAIDIWDMSPTLKTRSFMSSQAKSGRVSSISFSPDGLLLAAAIESFESDNEGAYVWELKSSKQILKLDSVVDAAFSLDGKTLATVTANGVVHLLDVAGWRERCSFNADHSSTVTFSPDSKWFVTGGGTAAASVWNSPPCQ